MDASGAPAKTFSKEIADEVFHRARAGDRAAISEIVEKNLPLVLWQAGKMTRSPLSMDDRVLEGNYGLFKAARSFNPALGFQFSTYATRAIWSSIKRASDEASLVRISQGTLQKARRRGQKIWSTVHTDCDFRRIVVPASSVSAPAEATDERAKLQRFMADLTDREQEVILRRFYGDQTLEQVGVELNVTRERIRQIEKMALTKMRRAMELAAA